MATEETTPATEQVLGQTTDEKAAKKEDKKNKEKAEPEAAQSPAAAAEKAPPEKEKKGKKGKKDAAEGETEEKTGKKGKKGKAEEAVPAEAEDAGEKKGKKQKGKKQPATAEGVEGGGEQKKEKKGKGKEPKEGEEQPAEGKKKGKGKASKEGEEPPAEEGGESKKKKGKKGAKEPQEENEGGEAPADEIQEKKKGKKGKKGKGEDAEGAAGGKPGKKGKKGKGKELESGGPHISITAFLEHFASNETDDDEWTWESYSVSEESIKEEVKEKAKKGKGKGKEKKGKKGEEAEGTAEEKKGKGKKGKEKEAEAAPKPAAEIVSTGTDIMAEIRKMKEMADAQALAATAEAEGVEEVSVAPSKKSKKSKKGKDEKSEGGTTGAGEAPAPTEKDKGPKKKLSKKEKAKLAAEMAEQARIQAELEAKRAEEEERIRQIEERKAAIEKERRETMEQRMRTEQLNNSLNSIRAMKKNNLERDVRDREHNEWEHFLKCDGLPNPYVCGEMNTYLHLWEKILENTTIDEAAERTNEVLKLLEMVTTFIDDPVGANQAQIDNWKWIHWLFREHQQMSLDTATYRLLRDIDKNLNSLNLLTSDYQRKEENFALSLWVLIKLPTAMPNPRKPAPPRIHIDFPDMRMNVVFPISIDCYCMAIRAMYVKYDHLSDLCSSYPKPNVPEQYAIDLYQATAEEWYSKLFYKYENHKKAQAKEKLEEGAAAQAPETEPPVVDRAAGIIPTVPYRKLEPTASVHIIAEEDTLYMEIRQGLITTVEERVINLRKYIIVGGVYFLNLYYQPPQPQDLVSINMTITRLKIPKCLGEVPFHVEYCTPPPIDPTAKREPEEIEEEIKKQEEELEHQVLVTLTLPQHIMWLDIPIICQWDDQKRVWTTADIHDLKHIEEKGYITFRTAKFGCFSLAANRFQNLPFQAWEMKPELDGTVTVQITAAILLVEFNIKNSLVCVLQFQNTPNNALQEIVGRYFKLPRLIRILQDGGLDFFPAFDAFCYIEGTCEKHWPMEKHLYYNMAQLSVCFNFGWSRWNMIAGRRSIVMQMREYKPERMKQVQHSMLQVTPLKTQFIECTEVSQAFNEDPIEGMHFYSDLYHLMKGTCGMATKNKVQNAKPELVGAVANLLLMTRVLSFS